MRDIYDIWYFSRNNWDVSADVIKARTGKSIKDHLTDCVSIIEQVKDSEILKGLGEFLSEEEKAWVKNDLRKDVVFLLKNYQSVLQ